MHILFVADPLSSFKIYKDTTFAMMREAARRGHELWACEPRQLRWQRGGRVQATVRRNYSSPAIHAAGIVSRVLGDPALRKAWEADVAGMRERAALYGGRVEATRVPGVGFTVSAIFPDLREFAGR